MENFGFEQESDYDFGFANDEDFGLAKSFTNAPMHQIHPLVNFKNDGTAELLADEPIATSEPNEIRADGFCFKLAPCEDQLQF